VSFKGEPAFIKTGFNNWKKSEAFKKDESSECHKNSLQSFHIWKSHKPVDHQLSEDAERQESYRQLKVKKIGL
ncbi:Hypothetical predicted protein, partial [Paramuricea clavata]